MGWSTGVDELVRQAAGGRSDAFEALVEHYGGEAYRLAAAIVGPEEARDVAQDAFLAAWRELPRLRQPDRFEPWLRRIVVNRSRNALRARRRRPSEPLSRSILERPTVSADFREAVHARAELDAAFTDLNADQRAVLALHYGTDLSIADTADALGIGVGTTKSRLNAALTLLRAALEGER